MRFKRDGVFSVVSYISFILDYLIILFVNLIDLLIFQVKDVFLPWYNAYRFLVQNAKRLEIEGLSPFSPIGFSELQLSTNVLDQWINSATESLVQFVRQEMDAYRLYTVCSSGFVWHICLTRM